MHSLSFHSQNTVDPHQKCSGSVAINEWNHNNAEPKYFFLAMLTLD
jgi:hypothetical protein